MADAAAVAAGLAPGVAAAAEVVAEAVAAEVRGSNCWPYVCCTGMRSSTFTLDAMISLLYSHKFENNAE